jgi:hypothetical protein
MMYESNAYRAACLSVHVVQLENRRTDLDEIRYGYYSTRFLFPKIGIPTWLTNQLARWLRINELSRCKGTSSREAVFSNPLTI